MDINYVKNRSQVLKNFRTLVSYRNSSDQTKVNFYKRKFKSGKTFIVEIIKSGTLEFAPSKFVGYTNNTMETDIKRHRKHRSGILTDKEFQKIYGKRLKSNDVLDSELQSFYNKHNINGSTVKPKSRLHYFISSSTYAIIKSSFSSIPEFFNPNDIIKYSAYAGKPYRKNNSKDERIGKEIREKLYDKTNYWLNSISITGYVKESNTLWQIGGYFSKYTWGRIFKENDRRKLIYFTVGIDFLERALIYKLDCQRKSPYGGIKLTKEQISKFDNIRSGSGAERVRINLKEIKKVDWSQLIKRTNDFIRKYDSLYEEAIKYVWGDSKIKQPKNSLEEVDPPDPGTLPPFKPTFKGRKSNHLKRQLEAKKTGFDGELLVINFEKKRLRGVLKPGRKIQHTSKDEGDGTGYDIKSYDKRGNEIFIEVKTTKSRDKSIPFNITPTELEFSKKNKKFFWLYRVYNFNKKENTGKVYRLNGNLFDLLDIQPDSYIGIFKR